MLPFLTGWPKHLSLGPDEQETAGALISSLLIMTWFVEARDPYTGGALVARIALLAHVGRGNGNCACRRGTDQPWWLSA
jgi:hypothetical protein